MPPPTALERLDLLLSCGVVDPIQSGFGPADREPAAEGLLDAAEDLRTRMFEAPDGDARWIASWLRVRGMMIREEDAADVLARRVGRLEPDHQEYRLVRGAARVLSTIREAAQQGLVPDGAFLTQLFQQLTRGIPRFRNNTIRQDSPWDAVLYVGYPDPAELPTLVDTFHLGTSFRDFPAAFQRLHPVRQGIRMMWRFARISPFPDFNKLLAWMAFCGWLLAKGYPLLTPDERDRKLIDHLVAGPPPSKHSALELRLFQQTERMLRGPDRQSG